jgi:hypothetical protein
MLSVCLVSAGLLTAGTTWAQQPTKPGCGSGCCTVPTAKAGSAAKPVTRVYAVADLVIPMGNNASTYAAEAASKMPHCPKECGSCPTTCVAQTAAWSTSRETPPTPATMEKQLMELIVNTVEPKSWSCQGGKGVIDYYSVGMGLVVNATPRVQEQVAHLLESLRRLQDINVAVEVRFLSVPESMYAQLKEGRQLGTEKSGQNGMYFLNDAQVRKLLDRCTADQRTNVMMAPKLSMFNGQEAKVCIAEQQFFVTNVETTKVNQQVCYVPKNEPVTTGVQIAVKPVVSADQRFVQLKFGADVTSLDSKVALFPVTTQVTPIFEGGAIGHPVPFTQYIQQPRLEVHSMQTTFTVPDGGTVLMTGWKKPNAIECSNPDTSIWDDVLEFLCTVCDVPEKPEPEADQVLILLTARVVVDQPEPQLFAGRGKTALESGVEEQEALPMPAVAKKPAGFLSAYAKEQKVERLLQQYHDACDEGRLADAKKLARKALAIDPACFRK